MAETCGLIMPIGRGCCEAACAEAACWPGEIGVSVNLSPLQFNQDAVMATLVAISERAGLPLQRLILEVTEGVLLEESRASCWARCRGCGRWACGSAWTISAPRMPG